MKKTTVKKLVQIGCSSIVLLLTGINISGAPLEKENTNSCPENDFVVAIEKMSSVGVYTGNKTYFQALSAQKNHIERLIVIFNAENQKLSGSYPSYQIAHYLGKIRAAEAVDCLASHISMRPPPGHPMTQDDEAAKDALIKIGSPAIPALIRNLANSDDGEVRRCSLEALVAIDGDKDIVTLRLQKVLKAETDKSKQQRLEAVIKSL